MRSDLIFPLVALGFSLYAAGYAAATNRVRKKCLDDFKAENLRRYGGSYDGDRWVGPWPDDEE